MFSLAASSCFGTPGWVFAKHCLARGGLRSQTTSVRSPGLVGFTNGTLISVSLVLINLQSCKERRLPVTEIDDIRARIDIVELVADYCPDLKRTGRHFSCRCPFHQENTPSFVVYPESQNWHCFGACAKGGDAFTFVMEAEGLSFPNAMKRLAGIAGITLADRRVRNEPINPLYAVNEAALKIFRDGFNADQGSLARSYAEARRLTDESLIRFGIGYALSSGQDLSRRLQALGFEPEAIVAAGLASASDRGELRDMFRGRLVFALRDTDGRVVGFAGRSLDGSNPKYINTPQTSIFDKGSILYGMDRAKDAVAQTGRAIVVEGYMDVIAAHEHGFRETVASMGTALTEGQVALLRTRADQVVLALDADAAGQEAMRRSLWDIAENVTARVGQEASVGRNPRAEIGRWSVAALSGAKDPDELIRDDLTKWRSALDQSKPVVDYLLDAEYQRGAMAASEGNAATIERFWHLLIGMNDWIAQDRFVQKLAQKLDIPRERLESAMGSRPGGRATTRRRPRDNKKPMAQADLLETSKKDVLGEHALRLAVNYAEIFERVSELPRAHLLGIENQELLRAFQQCDKIEDVSTHLDVQLSELLDELIGRELPPSDRRQRDADWNECLRRLEERHLKGLKAQESIALSGDNPEDSEYTESIRDNALSINQRLKDLYASGSN